MTRVDNDTSDSKGSKGEESLDLSAVINNVDNSSEIRTLNNEDNLVSHTFDPSDNDTSDSEGGKGEESLDLSAVINNADKFMKKSDRFLAALHDHRPESRKRKATHLFSDSEKSDDDQSSDDGDAAIGEPTRGGTNVVSPNLDIDRAIVITAFKGDHL